MQAEDPQPILVIDPTEAARLSRIHRDIHVSFDLFSTELQRLEATRVFLPELNFPEQENSEEWAILPSPSPAPTPSTIVRKTQSALDAHIQSYRSYVAKRNAETRFWNFVRRRQEQEQSHLEYSDAGNDEKKDDDHDTTCSEKEYPLLVVNDKHEKNYSDESRPTTTLEFFRRFYQAFIQK